jgi:hydroxymethylpyrimidine pyrophosphatase-like HAD family hydrolase
MKLAALALDYDGTIADHGALNPAVREAVADARRRGITVILATGRRLPELHRVAGDLTCFDIIVAENGAMLEFTASARTVRLGRPPPPAVLDAMTREGIPFEVGSSVIEAEARWGPRIVEIVRDLQQPLILTFNRSRLMVLPPGVCKSAGLRRALHAQRLSIHNVVGVGDAENDHDLLDACEVGAAVAWGSPALRAVADEVIEGSGPADVAPFIRRLARQPRLSAAQMGRRRLELGHEFDGTPVHLAIRGRTILIAGEPGTGKSWLAGLLCEQLILQGYCLCIIDPEGDYRPLEDLPGVVTLGGADPPPHAREIERALRHPDVSVIIDLSRLAHREKHLYLRTVLPLLAQVRKASGLPHKILIDEAHYFLDTPETGHLVDAELAGYILVTYRASRVHPSVSLADAIVMVTHETNPEEAASLVALCSATADRGSAAATLGELRMAEAALLPGPAEAGGRIRRFQLAPRLTAHVRHRAKYLDMPVADAHAFVFTGDGAKPLARAASIAQFLRALDEAPAATLAGHLRRHDFSRWLDHVFRDAPLAARVYGLEERLDGEDPADVAEAIGRLIRSRYETACDAPPA